MGDKSFAFVQKCLQYSKENPDLVPPFLDVAEFEKDVKATETLRSLHDSIIADC